MSEDRWVELKPISFQENSIQELNKVVYQQQKKRDGLEAT